MTDIISHDMLGYVESKLEDLDIPLERVVTDYSGRFMYGRNCIGIVSNAVSAAQAFAYWMGVALLANSEGVDPDDLAVPVDELWDVIENIAGNTSTDSMGLANIYYWPHLTYETAEATEE